MDDGLTGREDSVRADQEKSREYLARALVLESVQAARNEIAALKAHAEGRNAEEKLFRAMEQAQRVHWNKALMLLRGRTGSTDENLEQTLASLQQSLSSYMAMLENTDGPARGMADQLVRTTRNHMVLVRQVASRPPGTYHVCGICGFIAYDQAPERCPVCRALQEKFAVVD
ncbi:MAG: hypothetical protein GX443_16680 [Deltaproteobacteria bacterium]|nr:hypothetical protein [Deltaproteobacteria bacterium]